MLALDRVKKNIFAWIAICIMTILIYFFLRDDTIDKEYVYLLVAIYTIPVFFNIFRLVKFQKQIKTNKEYEGIIVNHVRIFKRSSYLKIKSGDKEIDTHSIYSSYNSDKYIGKKVKYVLIDRVAVITEEIKE